MIVLPITNCVFCEQNFCLDKVLSGSIATILKQYHPTIVLQENYRVQRHLPFYMCRDVRTVYHQKDTCVFVNPSSYSREICLEKLWISEHFHVCVYECVLSCSSLYSFET